MNSEAIAVNPLPTPPIHPHRPVLLRETLDLLAPRRGGLVVDCTLGPGGHAEALLDAIGPSGRLIGIDRDAESIRVAARRLEEYSGAFEPVHGDYRDLPGILRERGILAVDVLLADLGVSSLQIDSPDRGFSFSADGPLDMRMDRSRGATAADLLADLAEEDLERLLREFGEERAARRIARAIVRERERRALRTTRELAVLLERTLGRNPRSRIHPATRTFQALRIAVNGELDRLDTFVEAACGCLAPHGRAAFISFHSLEDRAVKRTLRALTPHCVCPRHEPRCVCGRPGIVAPVIRRAGRPAEEEVRQNPRSRSARLRVVERLPETPSDGAVGSGARR